ncbi:hypothetical protein [Nakamurella leprariae]|uniref:Ribosomal protein L7/L12 C-terminal domain-containing protein n=1 Tax=Nakamurella leprariae TaxID=2803911 RepID=A0A938YAN9_9ACTN|nr:hypothetical protein [Nakamurella leprariae]MBM9466131.1 hypothetical protein [Nakamurella leprariae]
MSWWVWTLLLVVIVVVVVVLVGRRAVRTLARPGVDPTELSIDPELIAEIRRLGAAGQKLQAIKVLRERTGVGLADAVRLVERWTAPRPDGSAGLSS